MLFPYHISYINLAWFELEASLSHNVLFPPELFKAEHQVSSAALPLGHTRRTVYSKKTCSREIVDTVSVCRYKYLFANMLLFCPTCGNVLIVEEGQKCMRFACNTCPYVHNITRKVTARATLPTSVKSKSRHHLISLVDVFVSTGEQQEVSEVEGGGWCPRWSCGLGKRRLNSWYAKFIIDSFCCV